LPTIHAAEDYQVADPVHLRHQYYKRMCLFNVLFGPGTDVMIFEIFSPKNSAKKLAFFAQTNTNFCKKMIITLVFENNANFLPKIVENRRKL
jgi:hypothetical protein